MFLLGKKEPLTCTRQHHSSLLEGFVVSASCRIGAYGCTCVHVTVFDSTFNLHLVPHLIHTCLIEPWQDVPNHSSSFTLLYGFLVMFSCPTHLPFDRWQKFFLPFGFGTSCSPSLALQGSLQTFSIYYLLCFYPFQWHVEFLACSFHWGPWYRGKKCFVIPGMLRNSMIISNHTRQSQRTVELAMKSLAGLVQNLGYPIQ